MPRSRAKDDVIRAGDRVRIIEPAFFVRCGYALTADDELANLAPETLGTVHALAHGNVGTYEKIIRLLAQAAVARKAYGGPARSLHTAKLPEHVGKVATVIGVRRVVTGTYKQGSAQDQTGYGQHYDEFEPPTLSSRKDHQLIRVEIFHRWPVVEIPYPGGVTCPACSLQSVPLEIEKTRVVKIKDVDV